MSFLIVAFLVVTNKQLISESLNSHVSVCVCVHTLPGSHEAERLEQEARGKLERQKIMDQAEAERTRKELLELEALR